MSFPLENILRVIEYRKEGLFIEGGGEWGIVSDRRLSAGYVRVVECLDDLDSEEIDVVYAPTVFEDCKSVLTRQVELNFNGRVYVGTGDRDLFADETEEE